MFTWISRARGLVLILMLTGCQIVPGGFAPAGQARALSVLGGAMTVAAPAGYCIDQRSARQQADGAVVLMGRCSGGSNLAPAVISVTIGVAGSAGVLADGGAAMAAFFQTTSGRAALSRTGTPEDVQVVQAANSNGSFKLRIVETGVGDYWRAVTGLSGRLVTLSVQGPATATLDPTEGRRLLEASILAIRKANSRG